ncbi:hypothetical protein [Methylobacterium fujisawaense]|uniref:hypothetical protein n=1 Tax=Methylobacterium fujisawaense TaxID=107400 RepID=UPI0036FD8D7C
MRATQSRWTAARAAIAVAALYALALQAILGGLLTTGFATPDHQLCLQSSALGDDGPVKSPPVHHHLSCCTAAHAQPILDAPAPVGTTIAWPLRRAVEVAWRPEVVLVPRAPPRHLPAARAPPVV